MKITALAAFEADAVAYPLKPIGQDSLARAIGRCQNLPSARSWKSGARSRRLLDRSPARPERIVVHTEKRFELVSLTEVVFFDIEHGQVRLHTTDEVDRVKPTIREFQPQLSQPPFFLAGRDVIVNRDREIGPSVIEPSVKATDVLLPADRAGSEIIVSERPFKKLRESLEDDRIPR